MALPDRLPYFSRPHLLGSALRLLLSGANVTLFAPRRHGKTLFVRHELLPAAHEAGWFAARVDLWRNRDQPALGLVEGLEAIAYATNKPGGSILTGGMTLKSVRATFKTPGVDIEGSWEPSMPPPPAAQESLENRLANALHLIAGHGTHALVALDEFQALDKPDNDNFVAAFRTTLQDLEGRLSVFFTGSSRDGLNKLFQRAKAPLFRSAQPLALPPLGGGFVDSRADYLMDVAGLAVDRDELKLLFQRLFHTPLFLNEIVRGMLVSGDVDVGNAFTAWLESKRTEEYSEMLDGLPDLDVALLHWLATSGQKSVYDAEARKSMADFMGEQCSPSTSKVQSAIRRLVKAQIAEPTGSTGAYELADQGLQIILNETPRTRTGDT